MRSSRFSPARFLLWLGLLVSLLGALSYFVQYSPVMDLFDTRRPGLFIGLTGIILSGLGFVLEQNQNGALWRKKLGMKILPVSLILVAFYVGNTYFAFQREEIRFASGDVVLAGTLLIPRGNGPHPALAMMHGSGPATRMGTFAEAQSLVRQGVAVLIYDKRGSGASLGGHYRFDGYEALAGDGVAAVEFLKRHSDIDPGRIGLWGTSEGGWTAPMAAAKINDLAFLIIVSGGPVTLEEQAAYALASRLRNEGFPPAAIDRAAALHAQYNAYIRTGLGRDALVTAVRQAAGEDWFQAADILPDKIPFHDQLSQRQQWWRSHIDTDIMPLLEKMNFPVLIILGANDPKIPAPLIQKRVESILESGGQRDFTVTIFPNATHNLVASPAGCGLFCPPDVTGIGPVLPWFAPGYLDAVAAWLGRRLEPAG